MGKIKITRAEMKDRFDVVCVRYGDLQHLFAHESPTYYSTRAEGWACDYYILPYAHQGSTRHIAISTGYAPIGRDPKDYSVIQKYDKKARDFLMKTRYSKSEAYQTAILNRWILELAQALERR